MAAGTRDRRNIQGARLVPTLDVSDLEAVLELIGQGQQALVVIPSNMPRGAGRGLTHPAPRGPDSLTVVPQGWQERWRHAHLCGLLVGVRDGDQGRLAELSGEEGHADW